MVRSVLAGGAMLAGMFAAAPADAQTGSAPPAGFAETLPKALAYESLSSLMETGFFVAIFGGGLHVAGPVLALNFTTSLGVYLLNEYAWAQYAPTASAEGESHVYERAATFRALTLARIYTIGAALGGGAGAPLLYTVSTNVADTALFIAFEDYLMPQKAVAQPAP